MNYKLIDTAGQITAVITDKISFGDLPKISCSLMGSVSVIEQVGWLQGTSFRMMGGELSINGTLAAAFLLGKSGQINGFDFRISGNLVTLIFPRNLILSTRANLVYLRGITYAISQESPGDTKISAITKKRLRRLAEGQAASGIIYYQNKAIKPLIYVRDTNSYDWENACGSGSLAAALFTGETNIIQPSGQKISVRLYKKFITVTTTVKEI